MDFKAQLRDLQQLAHFWLLAIIWGCLAVVGTGVSTVSAQDERPTVHLASLNLSQRQIMLGRRRRRGGRTELTQAELIAATYSRFSSDKQSETSITDQQRKCHEVADRDGHRIRPEYEYADEAVSGTKLRRDGLDALLRDAEAGEFHVLYFHSLSRLARESVITMPLLKQLVHVYGVRIISVTEGIDSARDGWEVIATIMALLHEKYIKELSENVFRGQEGAVLAGLCVGDYRFGYSSAPIPGSETTRKGRNAKPRMTYVIDDISAAWVVRIFYWFAVEERSLSWITRELNRRGAPKDHRSTTKDWRHNLVAGVLSSEKYVGIWPWGEMQNIRDPLSGDIRQEPRADETCEKWVRQFPHLRIIDDLTFAKAQERLEQNIEKYATNRRTDGTLNWSQSGSADAGPRHLLSVLIKCSECPAFFYAEANYLFCPGHRKGVCPCKTKLRRDRAERMILAAIGQRILGNPTWFLAVFNALQRSWQKREDQIPSELFATEQSLAALDLKIKRLLDCIEEDDKDPDIGRRLEERRAERRELQRKADRLKHRNEQRIPPPTEAWLRDQLTQLHQLLHEATPAACRALRELVGGQIIVSEIRQEGRERHFLRGQFTICATAVADAVLGMDAESSGGVPEVTTEAGEQITIDFIDPDPLDGPAEEAKALYDQGILNVEIAARMNCSKSQVTKLLHHWYESRGEQMPDGRGRRSQLLVKHLEPPMYQQLAEPAFALFSQGKLIQEIATELKCDRNTATAAIRFAHESRGLPMPDGRTRRKDLPRSGENDDAQEQAS